MPDDPQEQAMEVAQQLSAVSLKLPPVWPKSIDLWFTQVESQFTLKNITNEDTKFHHVVAVLDQGTAQRAASILKNPPAVDKYTALKKCLMSNCSASNLARAQTLLNMSSLGDRKPSDVFTLMETHRGSMSFEELGKVLYTAIFLDVLPNEVRVSLAANTEKSTEDLSKMADDMVLSKGSGEISAVNKSFAKKSKSNACTQMCTHRQRFVSISIHPPPAKKKSSAPATMSTTCWVAVLET